MKIYSIQITAFFPSRTWKSVVGCPRLLQMLNDTVRDASSFHTFCSLLYLACFHLPACHFLVTTRLMHQQALCPQSRQEETKRNKDLCQPYPPLFIGKEKAFLEAQSSRLILTAGWLEVSCMTTSRSVCAQGESDNYSGLDQRRFASWLRVRTKSLWDQGPAGITWTI